MPRTGINLRIEAAGHYTVVTFDTKDRSQEETQLRGLGSGLRWFGKSGHVAEDWVLWVKKSARPSIPSKPDDLTLQVIGDDR